MSCTRSQIVNKAREWVGLNEADGSHKKIIDIYNSHKPLARGYAMKYTDEWCACTVSALAIACGATDIIPLEVSCSKLIELAKAKGIFVEDDAYIPSPGDLILYDWEDNGVGENKAAPNHTGIVETVVENTITVIEGNYKNAVGRRTIKVNGKYIRGFITPHYAAEPAPNKGTTASTKTETATAGIKATDGAKSFLRSLAGTYKVTANSGLNVRHGACVTKKKMVAIPKNTTVKCYGYYTDCLGTKWLYIQFTYKGIQYTGFASSKYLKKI